MKKKSLPRALNVDVDMDELGAGLVGLVQAVGAAMRHQGAEVDADELICVSSAAFSNYVFEPEYNRHEEEPREYSLLGEFFSNYGPWESISYATDWNIAEVNNLPHDEVLKLAAFELASGRPMVTLDEALRPHLVTGYQISVDERLLELSSGETVAVVEGASLQGDSEVFENWFLLVRPAEQPEWAAPLVRQRINVLRWAIEHGVNQKEFFQETRENYAPGLRGVKRFREFLDGLTDPEGVEYAERYIARFAEARRAAGAVLPRWAESIADALDQPDVAGHLREAAEHYRNTGSTLADYDTMVEAFEVAERNEREALEVLAEAARYFPQAFEAL
jgi:hypothetical protein